MKINRNRNFWLDKDKTEPYFAKNISTNWYGLSLLAKEQPEYVCTDCANEFGYWYSNGQGIGRGKKESKRLNDYHTGKCECCGQDNFSIAHVKEYGYFYDGWQYKNKYK